MSPRAHDTNSWSETCAPGPGIRSLLAVLILKQSFFFRSITVPCLARLEAKCERFTVMSFRVYRYGLKQGHNFQPSFRGGSLSFVPNRRGGSCVF